MPAGMTSPGWRSSAVAVASALTLLLQVQPVHGMSSLPTGPSEGGSEAEQNLSILLSDMIPAKVRLLTDREFQAVLEREIALARKEVVLSLHLFTAVEGKDDRPGALAELLATVAGKGVQVIVVLEIGKETSLITQANKDAAALLAGRGVRVYADMSGTIVHAKLAVIDRRLVFIGSHDLTQQSLGWYREATLAVDSTVLATTVLGFIESLEPVPYQEP